MATRDASGYSICNSFLALKSGLIHLEELGRPNNANKRNLASLKATYSRLVCI
jgi:hypothetical protein